MIWDLAVLVAVSIVLLYAMTNLLAHWSPPSARIAAWLRPFAWIGWTTIGIDNLATGHRFSAAVDLFIAVVLFIEWRRRKDDDDDNPWKKWRKKVGSVLRVVFTPAGRLAVQ